jgi:fatty-acid desaturase
MREKFRRGIDWGVLFLLIAVHLVCLSACWFTTWQAVVAFLALSWFTGGIGVCLGYHRCITHKSFKTFRVIRWLLAFIGQASGQGSAIHWVAQHRKHHQYSDQPEDPHTPRDGFWWSHMLWFLPRLTRAEKQALHEKYVPDLQRDPVLRFFHHTFLVWHLTLGLTLFLIGYGLWDWYTGVSLVVWGVFVRMVVVFHSTWFVNSATHRWGYQRYNTGDESRNLWWVALITYGEGWHNNHHHSPAAAKHGHRWWEIDLTYEAIRVMSWCGLAWDIRT